MSQLVGSTGPTLLAQLVKYMLLQTVTETGRQNNIHHWLILTQVKRWWTETEQYGSAWHVTKVVMTAMQLWNVRNTKLKSYQYTVQLHCGYNKIKPKCASWRCTQQHINPAEFFMCSMWDFNFTKNF